MFDLQVNPTVEVQNRSEIRFLVFAKEKALRIEHKKNEVRHVASSFNLSPMLCKH